MVDLNFFGTPSWRDLLQPASFRGKKFHVSSTDTGVGRRNVVHQYPFRDIPYVEDLGREANEFVVNGYIIANKDNDYNHNNERAVLIKALREKGPGLLVHPAYGALNVCVVGKVRITESFDEGGIARFSMTFVQAGQNKYPVDKKDSVDELDKIAKDAEDAMLDSFGNKFKTALKTTGAAISKLAEDAQKLYSLQRRIMRAIQGGPRSLISTAVGFVDSSAGNTVNSIIGNACTTGGLILSSMDAFKSAGGVVGDFQDNLIEGVCSGSITRRDGGVTSSTTAKTGTISPGYGTSMVTEMLAVLDYGNDIEPTTITSENTAQDAINEEHMINLGRNTGLVAISQIAVRIDYVDKNSSDKILKAVVNGFDSQLERLGDNSSSSLYSVYGLSVADDESFIALQELRKTFVKSMQEIASSLPALIEYPVMIDALPAIVLAYDQYKDLARENEIITRNQIKIPHPGFLPGGATIEILGR